LPALQQRQPPGQTRCLPWKCFARAVAAASCRLPNRFVIIQCWTGPPPSGPPGSHCPRHPNATATGVILRQVCTLADRIPPRSNCCGARAVAWWRGGRCATSECFVAGRIRGSWWRLFTGCRQECRRRREQRRRRRVGTTLLPRRQRSLRRPQSPGRFRQHRLPDFFQHQPSHLSSPHERYNS